MQPIGKSGRIQKGEAVDLLVTVRNVGRGLAKNVKIELLELSRIRGIVVNTGFDRLQSLAPGEEAQVRLTVTTKKTARVTSLQPVLKVSESYLDVTKRERLNLPLDQDVPEPILAYRAKMYVGGDDAAIRAGAGDDTAVLARATAGTPMSVTGELGQWYRITTEGVDAGWIAREQLTSTAPDVQTAATTGGGVITVL